MELILQSRNLGRRMPGRAWFVISLGRLIGLLNPIAKERSGAKLILLVGCKTSKWLSIKRGIGCRTPAVMVVLQVNTICLLDCTRTANFVALRLLIKPI